MNIRDLLLEEWSEAARDLGLEIEGPFSLVLGTGACIAARLLLKRFGAQKGMIIVTDFSTVAPFIDEIFAAGYGFSTLSEPSERDRYNRDVFIEMLRDWGWGGPEELRPGWCLPMDNDADDPES